MDLITAQADLALRSAREQLAGRLGGRIAALREELLSLTAHVEAYIDFPDEDIDPDTGTALLARFDTVAREIGALLDTAGQGRILREGVRTVIHGEPNVGKSSLLNALLGSERAIVSEIPGTTRDTIEESLAVRGLPLRLIDTAGLRDSVDPVEQAGMARTLATLERADLALHVVDGSRPPTDRTPPQSAERAAVTILILNKSDLGLDAAWRNHPEAVAVSCQARTGIDAVADTIYQRASGVERCFGGHQCPAPGLFATRRSFAANGAGSTGGGIVGGVRGAGPARGARSGRRDHRGRGHGGNPRQDFRVVLHRQMT